MKFFKTTCNLVCCIFLMWPHHAFSQGDSQKESVEQANELTDLALTTLILSSTSDGKTSELTEDPCANVKQAEITFGKPLCGLAKKKGACKSSCTKLCGEVKRICNNNCPASVVPFGYRLACKFGCKAYYSAAKCYQTCLCAKSKRVCDCPSS